MASAPYTHPLTQQQPRVVPERGKLIPAWYVPHERDDIAVYEDTREGPVFFRVNEVQVTVGMLPPEHRWAVGPNGAMLSQAEFERHYRQWILDTFRASEDGMPEYFAVDAEPIPHIQNFLRLTVNPLDSSNLIEIGYDRFRPASGPVVRDAEPVVDKHVSEWAQPAPLKPDEKDAEIARLRAELEAKTPEASRDPSSPPESPAVASAPPALSTAPCGKQVKNVGAHKRLCRKCGGDPQALRKKKGD